MLERVAAFEFTRPLYDHEGVRDPKKLERASMRRQVLERAEQRGASAALAALVFDDPTQLTKRFVELLEWYWAEAFSAEWRRLEARLAESVEEAGHSIAARGMYTLLAALSSRLRVDVRREEFGLDLPTTTA